MPSYYLSPIGNDQQVSSAGAPLSGGKIFTYLAGTSTASATFTDNTGATPQANPIILNSLGLPTSPIWLLGGFPLKFIIKDSADVTIRTVDNISGVNDTSSTASEWTSSGLTPTYISATQFSVVGDQTAIFQVNRRVRTTNTGGLIYGRITVTSFGAGITTVTVVNDTGSMDAGLSAVAYGFLSFSPSSVPFALYAAAGANTDITSLQRSALPSLIQALPTPTLAANALTLPSATYALDFRNATLATGGTPNSFAGTIPAATIPSGATLGFINAVQGRILVRALYVSAGVVEYSFENVAGGMDASETGVISTTALSAASTSATTIYSTTARTGVPYRVLGFIDQTQATAGTYVTAPSLVQGQGGNALAAMSSLGYGQTWVLNGAGITRVSGTTYYNTTGKPITVYISDTTFISAINVNGVALNPTVTSNVVHTTFTVPPGQSYSYTAGNTLGRWAELR